MIGQAFSFDARAKPFPLGTVARDEDAEVVAATGQQGRRGDEVVRVLPRHEARGGEEERAPGRVLVPDRIGTCARVEHVCVRALWERGTEVSACDAVDEISCVIGVRHDCVRGQIRPPEDGDDITRDPLSARVLDARPSMELLDDDRDVEVGAENRLRKAAHDAIRERADIKWRCARQAKRCTQLRRLIREVLHSANAADPADAVYAKSRRHDLLPRPFGPRRDELDVMAARGESRVEFKERSFGAAHGGVVRRRPGEDSDEDHRRRAPAQNASPYKYK